MLAYDRFLGLLVLDATCRHDAPYVLEVEVRSLGQFSKAKCEHWP